MNATINASSSKVASICSIDDGIYQKSCDVAFFCRDIDEGLSHREIRKALVSVSRSIEVVIVL